MPAKTSLSFSYEPGRLIAGRYEIIECVGRGAMGTVLRASDSVLGKTEVALKVFYPHLTCQAHIRENIQRQVGITRQLAHPNIVRTFDFDNDGDEIYFVSMEYVDGWNFSEIIRQHASHPFPLEAALSFMMCIAKGLSYAHENGIIHGNLKPENILLNKSGGLQIGDFGIAGALEDENGLTRTGETIASPFYMAPEQFRGEGPSAATDIYSFGILAYRMLSGRQPFQAVQFLDLARTHLSEPIPPISSKCKNVPNWLEELVEECVEKDATNRVSSGVELAERFREGFKRNTINDRELSLKKFLPKARWSSQRRIALGLMPLFILIVILVLVLAVTQSRIRRNWGAAVMRLEKKMEVDLAWIKREIFMIDGRPDNPDDLFSALLRHRGNNFRALMLAGADINQKNEAGDAILHVIPGHFNMDIIDKAIADSREIGVSPADLNIQNRVGETPLHVAVRKNRFHSINFFLIHGASPYIPNPQGYTPFHLAIKTHNSKFIKLFLSFGVPVDFRGPQGKTPLMLAVEDFATEDQAARTVKLLLRSTPDLEARDNDGRTILHYAIARRLHSVLAVLLRHGVATDSTDTKGRTALSYALEKDDEAGAQILLDFGARLDRAYCIGETNDSKIMQKYCDRLTEGSEKAAASAEGGK